MGPRSADYLAGVPLACAKAGRAITFAIQAVMAW
jgi:hypothetical protein